MDYLIIVAIGITLIFPMVDDTHTKCWKHGRFWKIFEIYMTALSEKIAPVFSMNEFLRFEAKEICKDLEITTSNYKVIMYRARV